MHMDTVVGGEGRGGDRPKTLQMEEQSNVMNAIALGGFIMFFWCWFGEYVMALLHRYQVWDKCVRAIEWVLSYCTCCKPICQALYPCLQCCCPCWFPRHKHKKG